jgi:small nuclear ribonucleoprotein (snRNP)-like protein
VNHEVTVELKNDISVRGTLKSVDQYLNIKLDDISVVEELKYPHLVSCARFRLLRDEERGGSWAGAGAWRGHAA